MRRKYIETPGTNAIDSHPPSTSYVNVKVRFQPSGTYFRAQPAARPKAQPVARETEPATGRIHRVFHKRSTGRSTSLRQARSTEALYGRTRVGKAGRCGASRPCGERAQNAAEAVERRNLEQCRQRRAALRQESTTTRSHGQARTWPGGGKRRAKTNRCASSRSRLRTAPWRPANCSLGPSGQCGHAEQHQRPPLSLGRSRMR